MPSASYIPRAASSETVLLSPSITSRITPLKRAVSADVLWLYSGAYVRDIRHAFDLSMPPEKGTWEKIVDAVVRNYALFLLIAGAALTLLAANNGYPKYGFDLNRNIYWQGLVAILGVTLVAFGVLLVWKSQRRNDVSSTAREYGLKILAPRNNESVQKKIRLEGTFEKLPSELVAIIEYDPASEDYWFQNRVTFLASEGRWFANIVIGGEPDADRVLQIAVVG